MNDSIDTRVENAEKQPGIGQKIFGTYAGGPYAGQSKARGYVIPLIGLATSLAAGAYEIVKCVATKQPPEGGLDATLSAYGVIGTALWSALIFNETQNDGWVDPD